ncbi:MAG: hypothetical protein NUV55_09165 [Sulfuricaulis sp.]|uniref:choice-of-anchor U domain-containing protein n=1 Tax=Sulfuricaulis sp. TaxID=2003553 RepID=UPI0025ED0EA6|nr:choice-of-anchor U domain-containing protein [Sulfuricaulis sp.]MCR4347352.1 hypothetical protein [Sulfuricaulis sp.]
MKKLPVFLAIIMLVFNTMAQAGTAGLTGQYSGTHSLTILNGTNGVTLGTSTTNPNNAWSFDFDAGTFSMAPVSPTTGMLSVGFSYSFGGAFTLTDNGDGTYTGTYALTIGANPTTTTTIKWEITKTLYTLTVTTLDGDNNGISGTDIVGVLPLTVSPVMNGTAVLAGADSNGDGISDAVATSLGLDPTGLDGDTDDDGTSDVIEVGADVNNPTDSDGDGVINAIEPGSAASDASVAKGLAVSNGQTVTITATGQSLTQVSAGAATGGPVRVAFPYGTVSYVTTSAVGGSVTVRMAFSSDLPEADKLVIYKVGSAGAYALLPTSAWTKVGARTVDITLTDGNPATDLDGVANGSITDPIAVGNNVAGDPDFDHRESGRFGCSISSGNGNFRQAGDWWLLLMFLAWLGVFLIRKNPCLNRPATQRADARSMPDCKRQAR